MGLDSAAGIILPEGINEVIATTRNNAAPIGIIRKEDKLSVIIFKTSHTAKNVMTDSWMVAHITHDPVLFVKTAFEDPEASDFVEDYAGPFRIQRLRGINSWIAFKAEARNITHDRIFFSLEIIRTEISGTLEIPFHRGFSNLIEATIHATRFQFNHDPNLAFLIRHHGELVLRCGGPSEKKALSILYLYLNNGLTKDFFSF